MTRFRKIIGQIHLWLGLITGLVVLIVSITGCLFVFQKEISDLIHQETFFVKPPSSTVTLPYSTLLKKAEQALGKDHPVNFSTTYKDKEHAWEFMTYKAGDPKALTYFGSIDYYESVFINPYTGAVTGLHDYKYDFFNIVKFIHWSLLLNDTYGQNIVGYSTLIFVFMLVTGMIMWWPKKWSKTNINKSFKVKWKAGFKRVVYDLHNVSGFYVMLITLVLALTGMVFAFKWFQTTVYVVASGSTTPPEVKQVKSKPAPAVLYPVDIAFNKAKVLLPASDRINVSPAAGDEGVIYIYGIKGKETYYHADALQFDQYSGKLLYRRNYEEQNAGEKLVGMNYDIHVGAILGLPGKIIAFIASLVAASLPVTGFMIWLNRKKKKKKK
ncbi:PepSY-associated TM helix domain-containing protein [Pedobacter cryoconitis]|uniref:PepSY-associated TM helix domain-containing protein n=1 Tax=Pedobacter cryoconitis TaxID=188932 RepID=UPI00161B89A0|nr:PepSY-associated TM helix domain-containing protein [Pedobacter cryoconitis]